MNVRGDDHGMCWCKSLLDELDMYAIHSGLLLVVVRKYCGVRGNQADETHRGLPRCGAPRSAHG